MKIRILALFLLILSLVFAFSCRRNKDSFIKEDGPSYNYGSESDKNGNVEADEKESDIITDSITDIDTDIDSDISSDSDTDIDTEVEELDPLVGQTFTSDKGIVFEIIPGRTLSVVDYVGVTGDINIPKEYEGYKVTEIGEYAFSGYGVLVAEDENCQNMFGFVTIYIPETIKVIRKGAFLDCTDIKPYYDQYSNEMPISEWLSNLEIEDENKHVSDVLNDLRPAIGWGKYFIP